MLTDQTGAVVWDVDYKPFGEIANYVTNTLPVDQPFRFPGQYKDSMTGLDYNWNRYYMPEVGRYNRVDPRFAQYSCELKHPYANWQSYNSFHYIYNNPFISIDFNGLQCSCDNLKRIAQEIENMLLGLYDRTEKLIVLRYKGAVQNTECSWLGWGTTPSNSGFPPGIDCDSPEQNDDCPCSITHEFVHCLQCRSGMWISLGTNEKELPAYQAQLGCVKSRINNQCCN